MIQKKFEDINYADIQQLIDSAIQESKTLDYKRDLPGDNESDKRELLADVTSLANASGGDLVIGIADKKDANGKNTGIPEFYGLPGSLNTDLESQKLLNIIRDGIKPKIPITQIKFLDAADGKKVALVRVTKSWAAPHMVSFKTTPAFYSRNSVGKQPLDVHEIRNAFLEGEHLTQRIQDFRTDRLGQILADEVPCKLFSEKRIVLHLVPYQSLERTVSLNLAPVYNHQTQLLPIYSSGHGRRYNLHGLLLNNDSGGSVNSSYLQVYRDGRFEAVESALLSGHGREKNDATKILFITLEQKLISALEQYLRFYASNEVRAPVALMLSFLNVKGGCIVVDEWSSTRRESITEQHLILPDLLLEDLTHPAEQILRPCFDALWNACGYEKCLSYGNDGKWRDLSKGL